MVERGFELASRCCICEEEQNNMHHLLWDCKFSKQIWHWICSVFNFAIPKSFEDVWSSAKNKSPFIKECWIIAACAILKELWFQRNKLWFEQINPNIPRFKARIKKTIYEGSLRMKSNNWNSDIDNQVILYFKLEPRKIKFQNIKTCFWSPPCPGFIMFCCDGASIGNPGLAGFGVVIRDHLSQVLRVITGGIGIATNYLAEVYVVISVVELAVEWEVHNVILNSDSKTVITEFENNQMPWFVKMRWQKAIRHIQSIIFLHSYMETNFAADTTTKKGARLAAGQRQAYYGRPNILARVKQPNVEYYRIC
ncbi:uncharacterized protein LOC113324383 [Papaver somniferum]|uniref:uncharacterized protein LOC113324383 n=1 Tax=Papaver somniferum TaxID=3469 RepID=UPI000E702B8E|nr:uncharacterized protein LOC113324383 [Papaver somniferum]